MLRSTRLLRVVILLLLTLGAGLSASGQEVRRGSINGLSSFYKRINAAAKRASFSEWPDLPEGDGTEVFVLVSPNEAKIRIASEKPVELDLLKDVAFGLAAALNMPQATLVTLEGNHTNAVDLDLSRYILRNGSEQSISMKFGALAKYLHKSRVPRPIAISVATEDVSDAILASHDSVRNLDRPLFTTESATPADSTLRLDMRVHWLFYVASLFWLIPVALFVRVVTAGRRQGQRSTRKKRALGENPTPEQIQEQYDRQRPQWMISSGAVVIGGSVVFLLTSHAVSNSFELLTGLPFWSGVAIYFASLFGIVFIGAKVAKYRKIQRGEVGLKKKENRKTPSKSVNSVKWVLYLVFPLAIGMIAVASWPAYDVADLDRNRDITLAIAVTMLLAILVRVLLRGRFGEEGDDPGEWKDVVMAMAQEHGVRVRKVYVKDLKIPNAFASLDGSVTLTQGLIDKMEPEEVRAVIAHELGHLKHRHVLRTFLLSLPLTIGLFVGWDYLVFRYGTTLNPTLHSLLTSSIFLILVFNPITILISGPVRRRREREADAFAAEVMGDPELVIRTLVKLHNITRSPGRLKLSDEALSTHPSLVHRVEAIQARMPKPPRIE
jgi:Zn-dependent protease with chaperone function